MTWFHAIAAFAILLIVYTYVGYPVLITLLARLFPKRTRRLDSMSAWQPLVTACIPVHAAARYLDRKLTSLAAQDYPAEKLEILVYSDASDDESVDIARAWAARDPRIRVIIGEERRGKPHALNRMRALARGEVLLMTDVRQELSANAVSELVAALAPAEVACAAGNLVLCGAEGAGAYWRYEKFIRSQEASFRGLVGVSGALYAVRKADLAPLPEDVILDDMFVPMRLRLQGRQIVYTPAAHAYDEAFDDDREFRRKVRTLAGNFQLLARMPGLLFPWSNPSWFETISHKVMRLVCPFALAVLLVSSLAATFSSADAHTAWFARVLLAGQLAFYGLAAIGLFAGRLGAVARTFVVMNAAAMVGLWRWAGGRQSVTW